MAVLTSEQLKNGYFRDIGGFPGAPVITTVSEYDGSGRACIACTQLAGRFSDREARKLLREWIDFLTGHPEEFQALHFNTRVPQALLDAACAQRNLSELRCKWGSYTDLSRLRNCSRLEYLYLGSGASVQSLSPIPEMESLRVLYLENFRKIRDYSPLDRLADLEQLVICGPDLGNITIGNLDFVCRMPNLRSIWLPNVTLRHTLAERELLRSTGIAGIFGHEWWNL